MRGMWKMNRPISLWDFPNLCGNLLITFAIQKMKLFIILYSLPTWRMSPEGLEDDVSSLVKEESV
jgi:hypothetical protein